MADKQTARVEKVRAKAGVPLEVPVWASESGWAAYDSGVLIVKVDFGKQVRVPVQDLGSVDVRLSGPINKRGRIRFRRPSETVADRLELVFSRTDEPLFLQLKQLLDDEKQRGVQGQVRALMSPEEAEELQLSEEKIRSRYDIPREFPIWLGERSWVAYQDGTLAIKVQGFKPTRVALQEVVSIEMKPASAISSARIRFSREGDSFGTRQEVFFPRESEPEFQLLKQKLEDDQRDGVMGIVPVDEGEEATAQFEAKYRTKYKIPEDALLARAIGRGYISFDGHYVTIQQVALGRVIVGKGIKRIPVTAISSVQVKMPGWVLVGYMQFSLPGGNEVRSEFGRQTRDAVRDENTMAFDGSEAPAFLAMRDAIEAAQRALQQPAVQAASVPVPDDVFAQLEKLGKLRDAGIVSDAEFEAKKMELLARM